MNYLLEAFEKLNRLNEDKNVKQQNSPFVPDDEVEIIDESIGAKVIKNIIKNMTEEELTKPTENDINKGSDIYKDWIYKCKKKTKELLTQEIPINSESENLTNLDNENPADLDAENSMNPITEDFDSEEINLNDLGLNLTKYVETINNIIDTNIKNLKGDGRRFKYIKNHPNSTLQGHHIKLHCCGGKDDDLENFIFLNKAEHLMVHKALAEDNKGIRPFYNAYQILCNSFKGFTQEELEEVKELICDDLEDITEDDIKNAIVLQSLRSHSIDYSNDTVETVKMDQAQAEEHRNISYQKKKDRVCQKAHDTIEANKENFISNCTLFYKNDDIEKIECSILGRRCGITATNITRVINNIIFKNTSPYNRGFTIKEINPTDEIFKKAYHNPNNLKEATKLYFIKINKDIVIEEEDYVGAAPTDLYKVFNYLKTSQIEYFIYKPQKKATENDTDAALNIKDIINNFTLSDVTNINIDRNNYFIIYNTQNEEVGIIDDLTLFEKLNTGRTSNQKISTDSFRYLRSKIEKENCYAQDLFTCTQILYNDNEMSYNEIGNRINEVRPTKPCAIEKIYRYDLKDCSKLENSIENKIWGLTYQQLKKIRVKFFFTTCCI